jgi:hypothetical protein
MNELMPSLRHQNPKLFTNVEVRAKQEPIDLTFLGIQVWSIPKQLQK